ncbi:MAG: hypothetical protein RI900_1179 [Actinomycetota bacterium]|jgi:hypothetical protein
MASYQPIPDAHEPSGHTVRWSTWDHEHLDTTTVRWENEGFTVTGVLTRERVEYVLRLSASWQARQFILFRDLEEPDLWLATDGAGRWGEMNGAHRTEFDGCYDVLLAGAGFTLGLPLRRLPLLEGHTAELPVVVVDPDTLEARAEVHRYTRLGSHRWRHDDGNHHREFDVDAHGLVLDYPDAFRRVS